MSTGVRRSKRARTANQKYVNNDWDEDTLQLIAGSGSEDDLREAIVDAKDDRDFEGHKNNVSTDDDDDDDEDSQPDHAVSSGSSSPAEEHAPIVTIEVQPSKMKAPEIKRQKLRKVPDMHSRGLPHIDRKSSKNSVFFDTFGPSASDLDAVMQARSRWNSLSRDLTVPSRATLKECLGNEWKPQDSQSGNQSIVLVSSPCRQVTNPISLAELKVGKFLLNGPTQQVVLGPSDQLQMYVIKHLESHNNGIAWDENSDPRATTSTVQQEGTDAGIPDESSTVSAHSPRKKQRYHEGWLLNAGEKVQSLAWGTGAKSASLLAVACRTTLSQQERENTASERKAEAFAASHTYSSSIQIWYFHSHQTNTHDITIFDFARKPRLSCVIGTQVGNIRQLEWLPHTEGANMTDDIRRYQPLFVLSTDGCVRIVDVCTLLSDTSETVLCKLESADCCITPPAGVVFTTFTFASHNDVVIGATDGTARLYNIQECLNGEPQPYLTLQLHHTYILALSTAGQNELSHFLASASAAGDMRLTDLRSPSQDTLLVPKTRLPTSNLTYCPLTQSFVTTIDHSGRTDIQSARTLVVCHQLRHFYSQVAINRFPNGTGTAAAIAGSNLHPYLLSANSKGTVMCQNILRRLLPRAGGYMQKLWEYEWMPLKRKPNETDNGDLAEQPPGSTSESKLLFHGHDVRPGISRFYEGFRIEMPEVGGARDGKGKAKGKKTGKANSMENMQEFIVDDDENDMGGEIDLDEDPQPQNDHDDADMNIDNVDELTRPQSKKTKSPKKPKTKAKTAAAASTTDEVVAELIFEEEQAVTAMAWNQNPHRATWIAVGYGSGLIRVQDLSYDDKR